MTLIPLFRGQFFLFLMLFSLLWGCHLPETSSKSSQSLNTAGSVFDAKFITQSIPEALQAGQAYLVAISMQNTGLHAWNEGGTMMLKSEVSDGTATWTMNNEVILQEQVLPQQTKVFLFSITAPLQSGTFAFQWRMYQQGSGFFGQSTTLLSLIVFSRNLSPISTSTPTATPTPSSGSSPITLNWSPQITSNCHAFARPAPAYHDSFKGNCQAMSQGTPYWLLSATNEDANFFSEGCTGMNMWGLKPQTDDPTSPWQYAFHPLPDGKYQIGFVLDKIHFPQLLDRYTGVFINDIFKTDAGVYDFTMAQSFSISLDVALIANYTEFDSSPNGPVSCGTPTSGIVGMGKTRFTLGLSTVDEEQCLEVNNQKFCRNYFFEVNLYRSSNFDLFDDATNLYDRKSTWNSDSAIPSGGGEAIYLNGQQLAQISPAKNLTSFTAGELTSLSIPVSMLFQKVNWSIPPHFTKTKLKGVYMGHEIWGKGYLWVELRNYQITAN